MKPPVHNLTPSPLHPISRPASLEPRPDCIPVAFCATLPLVGKKHHWRISRIVTLPDYQGVGIGMRVVEAVADLHRAEGHRLNVTASHPALIAHCRRSPNWRAVNLMKTGSRHTDRFIPGYRGSAGRSVVSFEYIANSITNSQTTAHPAES